MHCQSVAVADSYKYSFKGIFGGFDSNYLNIDILNQKYVGQHEIITTRYFLTPNTNDYFILQMFLNKEWDQVFVG